MLYRDCDSALLSPEVVGRPGVDATHLGEDAEHLEKLKLALEDVRQRKKRKKEKNG